MSKQTRLVLTLLAASIALFAGLLRPSTSSSMGHRSAAYLASPPAFQLSGQRNPVRPKRVEPVTNPRNIALVAATEAVLKETGEIRQLSILRPVRSSTQTRAEIQQMVIKNLAEDTPPAQMHASEVALKRLGLVPPDFDLRGFLIRLLSEQVAGYYDPKTRDFHIADWIDLDGQKAVMAHELTHALQDQHFNLQRFAKWPKGDSDAELAAHALVEGDASLVMELYVTRDIRRAMALLKSMEGNVASAELDKAPRILRESLLFPYMQGEMWTKALYKRDGWTEVSQAYTTLPQSTEQILHPEKYFAHEAPVKVALPDISVFLNAGSVGDGCRGTGEKGKGKRGSDQATAVGSSLVTHHSSLSSPPIAGWRRIDYDVEGEWGFYLILDQFLKAPKESQRAVAGWGGDRFAIYEGPKGESLFVSHSIWDNEIDAREFFDAYVKRTERRYPDFRRVESSAADQTGKPRLETRNSEAVSFRTSEGSVVIELRATRVLILEGLPERMDSRPLIFSFWQ